MPIPVPRKNEKTSDYISRCIETMSERDPERKQSQIVAMCYQSARSAGRKTKKPKKKG